MSKALFDKLFDRLIAHEGGYVNHPKDPGGATNKGVTQRVYDDYRRRNGLPTRDVRQLQEAERLNIFRGSYWNPIKGDQLPAGVGYVVYDGAVNSGVSQSVKWLQRALGIKADGQTDPTGSQPCFQQHVTLLERVVLAIAQCTAHFPIVLYGRFDLGPD